MIKIPIIINVLKPGFISLLNSTVAKPCDTAFMLNNILQSKNTNRIWIPIKYKLIYTITILNLFQRFYILCIDILIEKLIIIINNQKINRITTN